MSGKTQQNLTGPEGGCAALAGLTLEDLLPHRDGMLLVGAVLEVDENAAVTRSRVVPAWPLAEKNGVSPLILVELAAQTAGVCNGWKRIRKLGQDSNKMGWLVAVKKADFHIETLPYGMDVTARSENSLVFDSFLEVSCALCCGEKRLAEVILQVYQA